eukprot:1160055-Pelagomonas_calceolata.AAC.7
MLLVVYTPEILKVWPGYETRHRTNTVPHRLPLLASHALAGTASGHRRRNRLHPAHHVWLLLYDGQRLAEIGAAHALCHASLPSSALENKEGF